MKNKLLRLLFLKNVRLVASPSLAHGLTYGIGRSTGRLVATDVWNKGQYDGQYDAMLKGSGRAVVEPGKLTDEAGLSAPWRKLSGRSIPGKVPLRIFRIF
jgi:hypothetical protein